MFLKPSWILLKWLIFIPLTVTSGIQPVQWVFGRNGRKVEPSDDTAAIASILPRVLDLMWVDTLLTSHTFTTLLLCLDKVFKFCIFHHFSWYGCWNLWNEVLILAICAKINMKNPLWNIFVFHDLRKKQAQWYNSFDYLSLMMVSEWLKTKYSGYHFQADISAGPRELLPQEVAVPSRSSRTLPWTSWLIWFPFSQVTQNISTVQAPGFLIWDVGWSCNSGGDSKSRLFFPQLLDCWSRDVHKCFL